eukprot:CAMPEP_0116886036 /NCGR_PEP_ID=MMETSP0463-20121206/19691_1 /TAXON_ID=181622 /ORGANISM="Strombidinopsis sp, Strain SopsisLIS2011" /LENGTH=152 /DNA_ID=CAMNT_0004545665 /DNA_START=139 /DNA_END=597 /DNA_ORIENTATION=+
MAYNNTHPIEIDTNSTSNKTLSDELLPSNDTIDEAKNENPKSKESKIYKGNLDANITVTVKYSTVSEYLHAVKKDLDSSNVTIPVQTTDFFPYYQHHALIWIGYYTTNPYIKKYARFLGGASKALGQHASLNYFRSLSTNNDHVEAVSEVML